MLVCLPLAAPIGPLILYIPTLCGSKRVLVVSAEPLDDLFLLGGGGHNLQSPVGAWRDRQTYRETKRLASACAPLHAHMFQSHDLPYCQHTCPLYILLSAPVHTAGVHSMHRLYARAHLQNSSRTSTKPMQSSTFGPHSKFETRSF